ncbi:hypothetical protein LCGC14_1896210 [marine sediment metagenome]|uniref:Uncharacterized protein n=1 Tax=marine sediment metagenome TaxID=412755 RepID=A0A0F9IW56_9ZZZZ
MDKIKKMLKDFSATLDKPFAPLQIDAHAEALADADPGLLQRALHRAYDMSHEYYGGRPSVAQIKGLMDDIRLEEYEAMKAEELADHRGARLNDVEHTELLSKMREFNRKFAVREER